jgi:hypothetical protein
MIVHEPAPGGKSRRLMVGIMPTSGENRAALSAKPWRDASRGATVDTSEPRGYRSAMEALHQFLGILTKPDNIPIVFMLVLVLFFTWVGFKQALRNDRLIEQGREEDVLKEMQR